mmetsp:Transcript_25285/g.83579  ORF Transcript_25285/g.83579 Transcript_25285/m.83579 type:complete len:189 (-) Transcript_25285:6900-7466(-)
MQKNHLLGRMASICAKKILQGDKIIIIRSELTSITGKLGRNVNKYKSIFKKKTNTNPRRGPFHFKSPSKILYQTIKRMIPHKTMRGSKALKNLKIFEGLPRIFSKIKKEKFFEAFRYKVIKNYRKTVNLGKVCEVLGWKNRKFIEQKSDQLAALGKVVLKKKKEIKKFRINNLLKFDKNNPIPKIFLK